MDFRKIRLVDVINPVKWVSIVKSWYIKNFVYSLSDVEQIAFRMSECSECVKKGSCVHCGCSSTKLLNKSESCSAGLWGPVKPKEEWEDYKETNGIENDFKTDFKDE